MKDFKKDYYKILQIEQSASVDEIKFTYRKLVKKYHPDLHPDQTTYEELIREIIEAYEVLNDKDERFAYDQFLLSRKTRQKQETNRENPIPKNKRTYTKTVTISKEEKTYLEGEIFIKYYGKHDERDAQNILKETYYKINITQTDALINQIHKINQPEELREIFTENLPISLAVEQPISCRFIDKNNTPQYYKLKLYDLTIPHPKIVNVTKHEKDSFGTITGTFYAYVKEVKKYEEHITVEECFGETGVTEDKFKDGVKYNRKEYYNTDCSKYWGNWIKEPISHTAQSTGRTQQYNNYRRYEKSYGPNVKTGWSNWKYQPSPANQANGCLGSIGSIAGIGVFSLLFLLFIPKLAVLIPFILIPFLLNLLPGKVWYWLPRIVGGLYLLLFSAAIISSISGIKNNWRKEAFVKPKSVIKKTRYIPVINPDDPEEIIDTIITHNVNWQDYDGKLYRGNFSVNKTTLDQARFYKNNLNLSSDSDSNYDKIIFSLKEHDKDKLSGLYAMFDSIKLANKPNPKMFAEIMVSFVQSIPYTLILPAACDAEYYQDDFTAKYLSRPDARCDGYEKFGVNTPVEFTANLNGDCDTRTLLLYTMLSHYNYDVALLSSSHYSHSILGINLPYDGASYNYDNQHYIFWETTAPNIKPGIISSDISDTDFWRISLKSK